MLKDRLLHPATIIATIALLVALSGIGYAQSKIGTGGLKNNAVTTAKIKNNAITTAKIRTGAVRDSDLGASSVTSRALAANAVAGSDLARGSVGAAALADGGVGAEKLATGAVTGPKLAAGSVTDDKLGPNAVTGAKIAGATITAANVAPGQFVRGNAEVVSGRLALAAAAPNTTLLTLPGMASFEVACSAAPSVPTVTLTNTSGAVLTVGTSGVNAASGAFAQRVEAAVGAPVPLANPGGAVNEGVQSSTWQLSYTGAGNVVHVATVNVAVSAAVGPATGCVASAQAVSTG